MLKLRTGDKVPNHEEKMQEQRGKSPFAEATYLEHVRKKKIVSHCKCLLELIIHLKHENFIKLVLLQGCGVAHSI